MKQTAFRLSEEELKRLDAKAKAIGVDRTDFIRILINTGSITGSYTGDKEITPSYTKKGKKSEKITPSYTKDKEPITKSYTKVTPNDPDDIFTTSQRT